ncbi:MAG: hypothetical protein AAGA58_15605 [Verrucomicrobiota bacterium]
MTVELLVTGMLTGLIWVVQVVVYPGFLKVRDKWGEYHGDYMRRIGFVVMPLMLVELGMSGMRLILSREMIDGVLFGFVLAVWLTTFFLQVPAHRRLQNGWDGGQIRFLVGSNWIRTVLWTGRLVLLGVVLLDSMEAH